MIVDKEMRDSSERYRMQKFKKWVEENGLRFAFFRSCDIDMAVSRVRNLAPAIDQVIFNRYFESFKTSGELGLSAEELALIIYIPKEVRTVQFELCDKRYEASIPPPIYCDEPSDIDEFDKAVNDRLDGKARPVRLPMKSLSVLLGISRYGRNNITYIDGLGSLFIMRSYAVKGLDENDIEISKPLGGFIDEDLQCPECDGCFACIASCPTGAISNDRFLLHAERCMTYHNKNDKEFPAWIDGSSHNCIFGCLQCQVCCPMDFGKLIKKPSGVVFDEDETRYLVGIHETSEVKAIEAGIESKLAKLGIAYLRELMPRNLRALFASGNLINTEPKLEETDAK